MLTTWQWVVGLIVAELIAVLLAYYFFLEPACCNEHTRDPQRRATRPQGLRLHIESGPGSDGGGFKLDMNHSGLQSPRILTLLTTYHNRTAYAKANIEAMEQRADGYKSLVSAKQRGHLLYVLVNAVCLLLSATWYEVFAVVGWDLRPLRLLLSAFSGKKLNEHVFFTYVRTYVRTYVLDAYRIYAVYISRRQGLLSALLLVLSLGSSRTVVTSCAFIIYHLVGSLTVNALYVLRSTWDIRGTGRN